jgi:hypothetical protein
MSQDSHSPDTPNKKPYQYYKQIRSPFANNFNLSRSGNNSLAPRELFPTTLTPNLVLGSDTDLISDPPIQETILDMHHLMRKNGPGPFSVIGGWKIWVQKNKDTALHNQVSTDWEIDQFIDPVSYNTAVIEVRGRLGDYQTTLDTTANLTHLRRAVDDHNIRLHGERCLTPTFVAYWTFAAIPSQDKICEYERMSDDIRRQYIKQQNLHERNKTTFSVWTAQQKLMPYYKLCGYRNTLPWEEMSIIQKISVYNQLREEMEREGPSQKVVAITTNIYTFDLIYELDLHAFECNLRAFSSSPNLYSAKHGKYASAVIGAILEQNTHLLYILSNMHESEKNINNPDICMYLSELKLDTHSFISVQCPPKYRPLDIASVVIQADEIADPNLLNIRLVDPSSNSDQQTWQSRSSSRPSTPNSTPPHSPNKTPLSSSQYPRHSSASSGTPFRQLFNNNPNY